MSNQGKDETGGEGKPRYQTSSPPSGILVKLFSNTIGFYISLMLYNLFSRPFEHPEKLIEPYVKKGQVVADIGCGLGNYALPMADSVGPAGKVYAIDLDEKCIRAVEKKAKKAGCHNIEPHVTSASDLGFIKDKSVDFILANGLL